MIVKCSKCQQEFEISENEYKDERKFFCSIECAVYAGYFSVKQGWLHSNENQRSEQTVYDF